MNARAGGVIYNLGISEECIGIFSDIPNISNEREFEPDSSCMLDEWLYVELDDEHYHQMIEEYYESLRNSAEYNTITRDCFSQTTLIFGSTNEEEYISFQKVTNGKHIERKNFLRYEFGLDVCEVENAIELQDQIDAVFISSSRRLYFKSFRRINNLFPGIEDYYRLGNEDDYNVVMNCPSVQSNLQISSVSNRNLHLIAVLVHESSVNLRESDTINRMIQHTHDFPEICLEVNHHNQFEINNNNDLNSFLKLALGRYYVNPITEERMEANSARRL